MAVKQILCDANIWIDFYKDDPGIIGNLKAIGQDNPALQPPSPALWITPLTRTEN